MHRIKFTNFIFMRMFPICLFLYLFLIIADIISFRIKAGKINYSLVPFEGIVPYTSMELIFAVSFVLCLCIIPLVFFSFFYKSKSIYTLVLVQPSKNSIYYSFLISGLINLLGLWLAQIIAIFICYATYGNQNKLFLSVVRLDFFRYFFPFSAIEWLRLAFILVTSVMAAIFIISVILKRNFRGLITVALWGIVILYCFSDFRNNLNPNYMRTNLFILSVAVFTTVRFIKKGRNALGGIAEL